VGNDLDLAVTLLADDDGVAEVSGAALNLDLLLKELGESADVENLVASGLRSVDDELHTPSQSTGFPEIFHCRGARLRFPSSLDWVWRGLFPYLLRLLLALTSLLL